MPYRTGKSQLKNRVQGSWRSLAKYLTKLELLPKLLLPFRMKTVFLSQLLGFITLGCFLCAPGLGSAGEPPDQAPQRPLVLVSIEPQAYFVTQLAGDSVEVHALIPKGASAETFEPTIRQLQMAEHARLYFTIGHPRFPFEAVWAKRLMEFNPNLAVVPTFVQGASRDSDIHVWLGPRLVSGMIGELSAHLATLLPAERGSIESRRDRLQERIGVLQENLKKRFAAFHGRSFVVFHPAWGYLARELGIEQVAIERDGKEPGPAQLAALVQEARREHISVIFVEPQIPESGAHSIAAEVGARIESLDGLAYDWFANMEHVADRLEQSFRKSS